MTQTKTASCVDIVSCLLEDHEALRRQLAVLRSKEESISRKQEILNGSFRYLLLAHTRAEEEVALSRALEMKELGVDAMEALEEHELMELELDRIKQAADLVQWQARMNVLCDLLEHHFTEEEEQLFPGLSERISGEEREEMGMRYREVKDRNELAPVFQMPVRDHLLAGETGRIGYIIAWLLGVPFWILLLVFLIRGA